MACPKCGGFDDPVTDWPEVRCVNCGERYFAGKNKEIIEAYNQREIALELKAKISSNEYYKKRNLTICPVCGVNQMAITSKQCDKCRYPETKTISQVIHEIVIQQEMELV